MMLRMIFAIIFIVLGITGFMLLQVNRAKVVTPLDDKLLNMSNSTSTKIYHTVNESILNMYDIGAWLILLSPFIFLVITILRREPETEHYYYT